MTKAVDLKPCPFCGGTRLNVPNPAKSPRYPEVYCWDCGASGPSMRGFTRGRYKDAWNTRHTPEVASAVSISDMTDRVSNSLNGEGGQ